MPAQHARYGRLVLAATALALLGACTRGDRERAAAEADTAAARTGAALDTAGARVGAAVDTVGGRVAGREYTNAELLGFVNAYNDAEVEIGRMAETRATDAQVREFARRIIREHRALKTEVTNAARQQNVTPTVPAADEDLREDHQEGMRDLQGKTRGREFDEAFLEHEIRMHKKVLDEVEDALGRNRNPEIRTVLERARDGLRAHLTTAEELEKKFGA
jgi:putative membrane protein